MLSQEKYKNSVHFSCSQPYACIVNVLLSQEESYRQYIFSFYTLSELFIYFKDTRVCIMICNCHVSLINCTP